MGTSKSLPTPSGGPWTQISSGDLGKWKYAPKGLGSQPKDKWSVDKPVYNLPAPATYRFQVSFRWIAHRQVLARQTLMSHTCFQPELRPDLFVKSINREPVRHQGSDAYVAVIRNRGATAAGSFDVRFSDGSVTKDRAVPGLPSHRQIHRGRSLPSELSPS